MTKFLLAIIAICSSIIISSCGNTNAENIPAPTVEKPKAPELPNEVIAGVTSIAVSEMAISDVEGECAGKGNKEVTYSVSLKTTYDAARTEKIDVRSWDCGDDKRTPAVIADYKKLIEATDAEMEVVFDRRDNNYVPVTLQTKEKVIQAKKGKIAKLIPSVVLWKEYRY